MKAVVLDIEGTVCSISFVHDILFPYALSKSRELIPKLSLPLDPNRSTLEKYLVKFPAEYTQSTTKLVDHIEYLTSNDVKAAYLKELQGYLWKEGYESGEIKAPLFKDVLPALKKWKAQGTKLYIYSSGSIAAQKLLFKYTNEGDLLSYFSGYFDTTNAGAKIQSSSYVTISKEIDVPAEDIHFYSDNVREIEAADAASWNTTWVVRPGNPVPGAGSYKPAKEVQSFA